MAIGMSGILSSTSATFVFRAAFVARLVISGIPLSVFVPFVLREAVTNPALVVILFSICVIFAL